MVRDYYERYWSDQGYAPHGAITGKLAALYDSVIPVGARCLDVGCGDGGRSGTWFHSHGREYVGVDVSGEAIRQARLKGLEAMQIESASALPFPNQSFDAAVAIEVLEHLFESYAATTEVFRVLRPGGMFIASVPNVAYWRRRLELGLLGRWNPFGDNLSVQQPWRDPHVRFFTRGALRSMLAQAGFHVSSVDGDYGGFFSDLPGVRRFAGRESSRLYNMAQQRFPALFGQRLTVVARKTSQPGS